MKVLRLYDHLGELKKEFNVYVEGEDFKHQESYPIPIWLGTIVLEEAGKEPEKPEEVVPEAVEPEPEKASVEDVLDLTAVVEEKLMEAEEKVEEVKSESKKLRRKSNRDKRAKPSSSS